MAYMTLNTESLRHNYHHLDTLFKMKGIKWAVVTKLLCGHEPYLKALLRMAPKQICDSRLAHLQKIKSLAPKMETIFIKPPAKRNAEMVVACADISCNSSLSTLRALSDAAVAMDKQHRVIIMVETGELREGVTTTGLEAFYEEALRMPNIEVVGLGTNLTCMYGVLPSYERLQELHDWKERLEALFGRSLPVLSGGASVTIPLAINDDLPLAINHFRVGESLFLGTDVYNGCAMANMHQNLFTLHVDILELHEKHNIPEGETGYNLNGEKASFGQHELPEKSIRALVNIGLLDIESRHLKPVDTDLRIAGASSDMMVLDLRNNDRCYQVGDTISFHLDYMGILRLMNSPYVEKRIDSRAEEARLALLN